MTITIPLPDWDSWYQWLQTPVHGDFQYWHVAAAVGYVLLCYIGMLTILACHNDPNSVQPAEWEEGIALLASPLLFPLVFALGLLSLACRILLLAGEVLRLPMRVLRRSDRPKQKTGNNTPPDSPADLYMR